ncbi:MAG TPA: polysaccharide biosynthesis/export family protein [Vicinamibacterales bacterium]|jgi:polysaccharide export outer membrane protein|nr:polysaccharide biosynthesis/export family protein [Vicinamibacterales bacterium]
MTTSLMALVLATGVATQASAQGVAAPGSSAPAQQGPARAGQTPAQTPAPAQTPLSAQTPPAPVPPPADYRIGPQDVLNITVFGEPTLSGKVRVDNDGTFPFQYLGRVKADELTLVEVESNIRKGLADGYVRNPQVSVEIDQYHSQNVYVLGEVRAPNKYSLPGNSTLIDVLTQAGSVTSTAGHWVYINHARQGTLIGGPAATSDTSTADLRINLNDIQSGKAQNVKIQDGDTIWIPKAQIIYVVGEVRTPGGFPYDETMTVFDAISLAGGVTEKGSNTRLSIRRLINGQMKEIDAKPTDFLKPGDQVNVKRRRL